MAVFPLFFRGCIDKHSRRDFFLSWAITRLGFPIIVLGRRKGKMVKKNGEKEGMQEFH
jgi:hypothetical protein